MKHGWLGLFGAVAAAGFAACGGNVVFDKPTGGAGGAGGAGNGGDGNIFVTSSTAISSSSGMTTSFDTGSSSGTGTMGCDDIGFCQGNDADGCVDCAVAGACEEITNACVSSPECEQFNNCIFGDCGGAFEECYKQCATQFPDGEALFSKLIVCVVCIECPNSCEGIGFDFLCQ